MGWFLVFRLAFIHRNMFCFFFCISTAKPEKFWIFFWNANSARRTTILYLADTKRTFLFVVSIFATEKLTAHSMKYVDQCKCYSLITTYFIHLLCTVGIDNISLSDLILLEMMKITWILRWNNSWCSPLSVTPPWNSISFYLHILFISYFSMRVDFFEFHFHWNFFTVHSAVTQ